jgi:hypothetical protein
MIESGSPGSVLTNHQGHKGARRKPSGISHLGVTSYPLWLMNLGHYRSPKHSCVLGMGGKQSCCHCYATCLWTRDCALAKFPGCGNGFPATGPSRLHECRWTGSGCACSGSGRERVGREVGDRARSGGAGSCRDYAGCTCQSAKAGRGEESVGERSEEKEGCWFGEPNQKTPQAHRGSAGWYSAEDRGSRGRSERAGGADCARHHSRRSCPPAPERGTVARLYRRQTETAGGAHAGRAPAGDGGTDPQLYGWCAFGVEGRRCAESKHAGGEGTFAVGRFGEALGAAKIDI